jgi:hypothetical protein
MRSKLQLCLISLLFSGAVTGHAAEWRECEQAKLRQLDMEQSRRQSSPSHKRKSAHSGTKKVSASAERIDDWLWKNCREYSYELRSLEQQRM